jgi:hypothetical protein
MYDPRMLAAMTGDPFPSPEHPLGFFCLHIRIDLHRVGFGLLE